jgi:hypothetical protein
MADCQESVSLKRSREFEEVVEGQREVTPLSASADQPGKEVETE